MIDKLGYVVALARERHFARAAESCGVTQPTLSAGLKQLEETLGVLIVQRSSRFLGFTPEGERVLAWARRLVGDAAALRQEIAALKQGLAGHLRLAVVPSALPLVARLTTPFCRRHPAVRLTVLSQPSDVIMRGIEAFEIEAGVTYLDHKGIDRLRSIALYPERYCFVCAATDAPPNDGTITWAETAHASLCLLTPDMQNRRIVERALRTAGLTPAPRLETNSMLVLLAHVRSGGWASILPAALLTLTTLPEGIVALPLVGPESVNLIGLVAPDTDPMGTSVHALFGEAARVGKDFAGLA